MLPTGEKYFHAVQNPNLAFSDPDLVASKVENGNFGLPRPYSGGFTTTFRAFAPNKTAWAVRCFTKPIDGLEKRYAAFERFFRSKSSPYFTETFFLQNGIRVDAAWHPIIKMRWLEGMALNEYVAAHLSQPARISSLLQTFEKLVQHLDGTAIAHGDLQHGNLIFTPSGLRLIDYDGLYVPELKAMPANEIGHINFQHPQRQAAHFGQSMDRFAIIVIYLALKAVSLDPGLWKKYDNGDNLLFTRQDFDDPASSLVLLEIGGRRELADLAERFRGVCVGSYDAIPSLQAFLTGAFSFKKVISVQRPSAQQVVAKAQQQISQYPVLDATKKASLLEHVGLRVEAIGRITQATMRFYRRKVPYLFLNIGKWPIQSLTLVLWSKTLKAFAAAGIDPETYEGHWVRVTGVITTYEGSPQIVVEAVNQLHVLTGEADAKRWLKITSASLSGSHIGAGGSAAKREKLTEEEEALARIYGTTSRPSQTIPEKSAVPISTTQSPVLPSRPTTSAGTSGGTVPSPVAVGKTSNDGCGCLLAIVFGFGLASLFQEMNTMFLLLAIGAVAGWQIGKRIN